MTDATPTIRVEAVSPDAFDEIYPPLLRVLDPHRPREEWRRIFSYAWRPAADPVGWVLRDGGRPVGFLGAIFSERPVAGVPRRFCNISSWIALESHRAEASLLVMPLRRLRGCTVTNLTPTPAVHRTFTALGFSVLDAEWTVLRPAGHFLRPSGGCEVLTDPEAIAPRLDDADRRILADHRPFTHALLAEDARGRCLVLYTLGRRRRLRSARMHYLGDAAVFRRCWPAIHRRLLGRHGAALAECDSRLLPGPPMAGSYRTPIVPAPRMYRSAELQPAEIPNIYSELVLLNLL